MAKTTTKKTKVIGKQQYINQSTGEIIETNVITVEDRDFNFHKIWLEHILSTMDIIGNQKTKLAFWIMDNLDKENKITMTYRQIADKSGMSYQTVYRTMNALIECDFMVKINSGAYRVNPDKLFKGSMTNRLNVLIQYKGEKQENELKGQQHIEDIEGVM
jgi:uncharacterized protein YcgI (DUF1989 family)